MWATDHDLEHYSLHHLEQVLETKKKENKQKMEVKELVSRS